jgi:hypothetical protein
MKRRGREPYAWRRRAAGAAWLLLWLVALHVVTDPWRHLGGLVDEYLRWLEWFVLGCGASLGFTAGQFVRDSMEQGTRSHVQALRVLLYPPAILAAAELLALRAMGEHHSIGVVVTALLAYWCGLDLACGVVPLLKGEPYSFRDTPEASRGRPVRSGADGLPSPGR